VRVALDEKASIFHNDWLDAESLVGLYIKNFYNM